MGMIYIYSPNTFALRAEDSVVQICVCLLYRPPRVHGSGYFLSGVPHVFLIVMSVSSKLSDFISLFKNMPAGGMSILYHSWCVCLSVFVCMCE